MPDDILHIHGFSGCPFFRRASRAALAAVEEGNLALAQGINIKAHATREEYFSWLHGSFAAELGHTTSPLVFTVASGAFQTPRYIGGCSQLVRLLGAGIVALPPDTARETVGERGAAPDSASAPRVPLVGEVGAPLRVFVAGDRSQVGKSSVCLGLLAALLRAGYSPGELAYIKPATQCESPQLIGKFCGSHGTCFALHPRSYNRSQVSHGPQRRCRHPLPPNWANRVLRGLYARVRRRKARGAGDVVEPRGVSCRRHRPQSPCCRHRRRRLPGSRVHLRAVERRGSAEAARPSLASWKEGAQCAAPRVVMAMC